MMCLFMIVVGIFTWLNLIALFVSSASYAYKPKPIRSSFAIVSQSKYIIGGTTS